MLMMLWIVLMLPSDSIRVAGYFCDFEALRRFHDQAVQAVEVGGFREDVLALALTNYYLTGCGMAYKLDEDTLKFYIDEALEALMDFDSEGSDADVQAFISLFAGMRINFTGFPKLLTYTKMSSKALKAGKEADSTNPRIWLAEGISKFHTPKAFGGGPDKAMPILKRTLKLFENRENQDYLKDWGNEIAILYTAMCYVELGDTASAIREAREGVKRYPNYKRLTKFYEKLKGSISTGKERAR